MKRLALLLIFVLVFTTVFACAEVYNFSEMDNAQLYEILESVQAELAKRKPQSSEDADNPVLIDQEGIYMYLTGNHEVWGYEDSWYLDLEVVVENNSDVTVSILADGSSINGWNVAGFGITDTQSGKKQKGSIELYLTDAEISTFEEVEEIELHLLIYNSDDWETIATVEPITLHF
ncbi:MAG: hypothetical protein Q4G06_10590 [Clostridia bacterium]|nr:hypothetical protein [Clostridia bacterium]